MQRPATLPAFSFETASPILSNEYDSSSGLIAPWPASVSRPQCLFRLTYLNGELQGHPAIVPCADYGACGFDVLANQRQWVTKLGDIRNGS